MEFIDLHVHSNASDGTLSPSQVVELARRQNLRAIALTDHDTLDGLGEVREAGRALGVEVVCGIEFSTSYEGRDVHILGLDLNLQNAYFTEASRNFSVPGTVGTCPSSKSSRSTA